MNKIITGVLISIATLAGLFMLVSSPAEDQPLADPGQSALATEATDQQAEPKLYSTSEVAKHSTIDDCWTIIDDIVYDITQFVRNHPGGEVILTICGVDGTEDFKNQGAPKELADNVREENNLPPDSEFHSPDARSVLEAYRIGVLQI